jgi:hypothetical protein
VCLYDEVEHISDIKRIAHLDKEIPLAKIKGNDCPADSSLFFKELVINARGQMEDETFAIDPKLSKNIRRGNTIIEIMKNGKVIKTIYGRKGLTKFFDLRIEYV